MAHMESSTLPRSMFSRGGRQGCKRLQALRPTNFATRELLKQSHTFHTSFWSLSTSSRLGSARDGPV